VEAEYPSTTSKAAEEGTLAHLLLESALMMETQPIDVMAGASADGVFKDVHGEMVELINNVYLSVLALGGKLFIESRVNPGKLLGLGDNLMWGTADIIVALPDEKKLIVADLKFGKSRVSPKSDQLKIYAFGATDLVDYDVETFELIIYQPRLHTGKSHIMSASDMKIFADELFNDALATMPESDPQRVAGSACFWCRARKDCSVLNHKMATDAFSKIDF